MSDRVHGDGFKFFDYYASIGIPATEVVRHRVSANSDPWFAAGLATGGSHEQLLPGLKQAMATAARILASADGLD
jgi:hypothetical protein